jgi:chromosome segregation ATPase
LLAADMISQELTRELQTHADDIKHLQEDLKELKAETNMKFADRDERHNEQEETLQGVLKSQERLNDTLNDLAKRFTEVYDTHLISKHGPEWVKKTISNMKIYAIIGMGSLALWNFDVILPYILKAIGQ